ncbi:MAG: AraC family transcriptional regulator, partial [Pseudomonadota bacterium]
MAAEDAGDLTQEERALAKGGLAGWQVRAISRLAEAQLESLTVRAMAAAVDLSPHHFSRPFRMSFGAPPREWLIR